MKRSTSKATEVMFAASDVEQAYLKLKASRNVTDQELLQEIEQALDALRANPFCGIEIQKKLIPSDYIHRYGVKNLWKYNLRHGWRLIYATFGDDVVVLAVVLEWFDHSDYEKRFGY